MDRRSGGGGGVTCVFGKNKGLAVLRFQVAIVFNKKAWNQTARELFCFYFSPGYFFNVASGGEGRWLPL